MPTPENRTYQWIWQRPDWPEFDWATSVTALTRDIQKQIGQLLGKADVLDDTGKEKMLDTLLHNILASSAIEGERLDALSVKSSLANRLGVMHEQQYPTSARSEGVADMMLDAIDNRYEDLTLERLLQWHRWLFPEPPRIGHSVAVGSLRNEEMEVVSWRGADRKHIHFIAPPPHRLEREVNAFLNWFNESRDQDTMDPLERAALAHLWFVTIHPFDDGNGRITRAITDLALAQADDQSIRLYAMSEAILDNRKGYYDILESTQRNGLDISRWMTWFMETLSEALDQAQLAINRTIQKARFWQRFEGVELNGSQQKLLNRLLEGGPDNFEDGISAAKYQKLAKVSKATATRHLSDLAKKGCLEKCPEGGRSTRYHLPECYRSDNHSAGGKR
ncbi:Fic family protein [Halospina denitrificans]|uniref:Fic family protein n=1 Tax=Halospina denitrificans TaxID=332522 RepID=A0A4R7JJK4_9GAMM|nr:Fic family protein [Halospina denitrificans]TDT37744.1 Fic family protein [Halospina denitrificans]